jgi:hypothetical protein
VAAWAQIVDNEKQSDANNNVRADIKWQKDMEAGRMEQGAQRKSREGNVKCGIRKEGGAKERKGVQRSSTPIDQ